MTTPDNLPGTRYGHRQPVERKRLFGTLIRVKPEGYGFIRPDEGPEYFVHISRMQDSSYWRENQRVSFIPGKAPARGKNSRRAAPAYEVVALLGVQVKQ